MNFTFVKKIENIKIPIYFEKNYLEIMAYNDKAEYKILKIILKNNSEIYLPFLLKKISNNIYEAYSAYGYGGFYSNNSKSMKLELKNNWTEFENFMRNDNIIDLFLRNSPFLANYDFVPEKFNEFNRTTFIRKLKPYNNLKEFTKNVKQKLRWSINYAVKNGLKIEFRRYGDLEKNELLGFYQIYTKVMNYRGADDYYFFKLKFFENHFYLLKNNCELALIMEKGNNKIIGGSIFLLDDLGLVHYHFSGFNRDYSKYQPMELLLSEAILRYGNLGKNMLHLGGGISIEDNDGLFKFKSKFATNKLNFHISKIIFDQEKYNKLRNKYQVLNSKMFLIKDAVEFNKQVKRKICL